MSSDDTKGETYQAEQDEEVHGVSRGEPDTAFDLDPEGQVGADGEPPHADADQPPPLPPEGKTTTKVPFLS